jgi:hypothetical protein
LLKLALNTIILTFDCFCIFFYCCWQQSNGSWIITCLLISYKITSFLTIYLHHLKVLYCDNILTIFALKMRYVYYINVIIHVQQTGRDRMFENGIHTMYILHEYNVHTSVYVHVPHKHICTFCTCTTQTYTYMYFTMHILVLGIG